MYNLTEGTLRTRGHKIPDWKTRDETKKSKLKRHAGLQKCETEETIRIAGILREIVGNCRRNYS